MVKNVACAASPMTSTAATARPERDRHQDPPPARCPAHTPRDADGDRDQTHLEPRGGIAEDRKGKEDGPVRTTARGLSETIAACGSTPRGFLTSQSTDAASNVTGG